jgi:hypothetical protein
MGVGCDILFKIFEMGVGGRLACVAGSLVNYVKDDLPAVDYIVLGLVGRRV